MREIVIEMAWKKERWQNDDGDEGRRIKEEEKEEGKREKEREKMETGQLPEEVPLPSSD